MLVRTAAPAAKTGRQPAGDDKAEAGGDRKEPAESGQDYFRTSVKARGILTVTKEKAATSSGVFNDQPVGAVLHGVPLFFGGDNDLIELARKLDGKTVILTGTMATDVSGGRIRRGSVNCSITSV